MLSSESAMLLALSQVYIQGLHKWLLVCNPSSSVVRLLYALSPFELLEQNPTVWAAYRQHKVISHVSGAENQGISHGCVPPAS